MTKRKRKLTSAAYKLGLWLLVLAPGVGMIAFGAHVHSSSAGVVGLTWMAYGVWTLVSYLDDEMRDGADYMCSYQALAKEWRKETGRDVPAWVKPDAEAGE